LTSRRRDAVNGFSSEAATAIRLLNILRPSNVIALGFIRNRLDQ
jgi:hypothetical protein